MGTSSGKVMEAREEFSFHPTAAQCHSGFVVVVVTKCPTGRGLKSHLGLILHKEARAGNGKQGSRTWLKWSDTAS